MVTILILVGIILLLATHFLYKNTKEVTISYSCKKNYGDIKTKRIFKILLVVASLIPVLNIIVFVTILMFWLTNIICEDYTFHPNSKFLSKVINYLNEEV